MHIEIDSNSGFCFGVQRAIELAEKALENGQTVYCLGEMVHNPEEIKRLEQKGMKTIKTEDLPAITGSQILVRAHGEPPSTFDTIQKNENTLFEGTCPIVKQIQKKIKLAWEQSKTNNGQVVVYGKKGHAEVVGFLGQTNYEAILVSGLDDLDKIDFGRPVELFTQTTMDSAKYAAIAAELQKRMVAKTGNDNIPFIMHKTICGYVSGRGEKLKLFSQKHDVVVFVSGMNSSNGKVLYELCKSVNEQSYWVENESQLEKYWFQSAQSVGICGATSTPRWLMEKIAERIKNI